MENYNDNQTTTLSTKFEKTNIFVNTRIMKLNELSTLTKVIDYFKEQVSGQNLNNLIIDDSVVTFSNIENWDQKNITVSRRLLRFTDEVSYKQIVRRKYVKYHLCEALIRMSELVKMGQISLSNNTGILIHLNHSKDLYPCILKLFHFASGKLELRVVQMYNQHLFFKGSSFLT